MSGYDIGSIPAHPSRGSRPGRYAADIGREFRDAAEIGQRATTREATRLPLAGAALYAAEIGRRGIPSQVANYGHVDLSS